jgi:hypothetical protein
VTSWLPPKQSVAHQRHMRVCVEGRRHRPRLAQRCGELDQFWLFPAEQARIVQLLIERVDVRSHGLEVKLRPTGLAGLVPEVTGSRSAAA